MPLRLWEEDVGLNCALACLRGPHYTLDTNEIADSILQLQLVINEHIG